MGPGVAAADGNSGWGGFRSICDYSLPSNRQNRMQLRMVATANSRRESEKLLATLQISPYFDGTYSLAYSSNNTFLFLLRSLLTSRAVSPPALESTWIKYVNQFLTELRKYLLPPRPSRWQPASVQYSSQQRTMAGYEAESPSWMLMLGISSYLWLCWLARHCYTGEDRDRVRFVYDSFVMVQARVCLVSCSIVRDMFNIEVGQLWVWGSRLSIVVRVSRVSMGWNCMLIMVQILYRCHFYNLRQGQYGSGQVVNSIQYYYKMPQNSPRKKKALQGGNPKQAFSSLWSASSQIGEYNALQDMHSTCYFGNPTVRSRMKQLAHVADRCTPRGHALRASEINRQCKRIKNILRKHENIQNVKIMPYCTDLKYQSQEKLKEFKRVLNIKQIEQEKEHEKYLKEYWVSKQPDQPGIKMVRTLQPIQNLHIKKMSNLNDYIYQPARVPEKGKKNGPRVGDGKEE